ncbi:hypothetical protein POM88_027828 [Heracleum sosnowskyi]|uniref:NAC domain-containing protein n=1 Tax=Heracleum sosnowskyi TaxID=360622 RepID=A0AAD8I8J6_9APIA|nr:hypothetical protein POM88_027828 [Heracleum sosnowskyi]
MAGCGTWHGEISRNPIMEDDRVIGFTRLLVYQISDVDSCLRNEVNFNKIDHWLIHEYVLSGYEYEDYVLCRISVDMSKITQVKPKSAPRIFSNINSKANKKITVNKSKVNKKTTSKVSKSDKASKETATNHNIGSFGEEKGC